MPGLPSGTVTFLFTDIEGSTARWEHQPEAMRVALARHDALVREVIQAHGGYVVKTMGDAFHAAFPRAPDAVTAAMEAQRRLQAEPWGAIGPIRVRMALHTGAAEERDGDYYGPTLNRAARILSAGHGGQVLLSQATHELVRDVLPKGTTLADLGEHRLKDLIRPERVFQLSSTGLGSDFPPLRTLDRHPNNLPIQTTPLIGREQAVAAVTTLLMHADVRLVTLTGPGGIGKTRLALQVAAELASDFGDGVFFVELAPISDSGLVASRVAQTLGLADASGRPLLDVLVDRLRDRRVLLLLDNFEQVLDAASVVDDLLWRCPMLSALVTSRAPLQLRSEHEYPVPPLVLPAAGQPITPAALSQYEAVALFIDRATAIRPDFGVTNANAPAVAAICARLDGLPLAIELAAARTRLLAPEALLARLGHSLDLLTGGRRDLPARQQTLRSAIAWSYDLLHPPEQRLYRRLGVFVGGFTLEAVETVCDQDGDLGIDILDGVGALIDASLVRQDHTVGNEPRFTMLETIREYALERLEASREASRAHLRHRDYFVTFTESAAPELRGRQGTIWFDRLEEEHGNCRAALDAVEAESNGTDVAATMAGDLAWFWVMRGHGREAQGRVGRLVARTTGSPASRATLLGVAGFIGVQMGDIAAAIPCLERSLALWQEIGDERGLATGLANLAAATWQRGDQATAMVLIEECVDLLRRVGARRPHSEIIATYVESPIATLARLSEYHGDRARAGSLFDEALSICRANGDRHGIANALRGLGSLAFGEGATERAATLLQESLGLLRELVDAPCGTDNLEQLAYVATLRGQYVRAARFLGAAERLRNDAGIAPRPSARAVHDQTVAAACTALGEEAFTAEWSTGGEMTLQQAVAYSLEGVG
ncbi:MAG: adenylate/guanylate cyclase domain-containing protein [Chloroflexi bacterium]|nr:adenylate/guanylate cyclase domain-containing protein [Chloroflexota bacterium]